MDEVFAPWRMNWIQRETNTDDGCVFCNLEIATDDRENHVLARNESSYAVLNIAPYNPGHTLVIPNDHGSEYLKLDDQTIQELHLLVQKTVQAINHALEPDGFNIGMNLGPAGGASIESHLHVHVVPRWERDTTFMPTTANAKMIVEALDETYERIHSAFARQEDTKTNGDDVAVDVQS